MFEIHQMLIVRRKMAIFPVYSSSCYALTEGKWTFIACFCSMQIASFSLFTIFQTESGRVYNVQQVLFFWTLFDRCY